MTFRKSLKHWLYDSCPGFAGAFTYFGTSVYFPKHSLVFRRVCEEGIFEWDNVQLLRQLVKPGTWFFDVGTNIGLMSIPILSQFSDVNVLSFEPSPNVLPFLQRTIAGSPQSRQWKLISKAVGESQGKVIFCLSAKENNLFDGIKNTRRVSSVKQVEVELTTIDMEWEKIGSPSVSVVKIDIEGGEIYALRGASNCLKANRPFVLTEWNAQNLSAFDCLPSALIEFAREHKYHVFALPNLIEVCSAAILELHMLRTENFLLAPNGSSL